MSTRFLGAVEDAPSQVVRANGEPDANHIRPDGGDLDTRQVQLQRAYVWCGLSSHARLLSDTSADGAFVTLFLT